MTSEPHAAASQIHAAAPLRGGPGVAAAAEVGVAATAAAEVELLADLIERGLVLVVGELQIREHPPAHAVDAESVHAFERLVALPGLEIA